MFLPVHIIRIVSSEFGAGLGSFGSEMTKHWFVIILINGFPNPYCESYAKNLLPAPEASAQKWQTIVLSFIKIHDFRIPDGTNPKFNFCCRPTIFRPTEFQKDFCFLIKINDFGFFILAELTESGAGHDFSVHRITNHLFSCIQITPASTPNMNFKFCYLFFNNFWKQLKILFSFFLRLNFDMREAGGTL